MAIKYLSNISLEGNELQNVKIHPAGTAPANGAGGLWYDTSTNKLMVNNGSAWYSVNGDIESLSSANTNVLTIGGTASAPTVDAVTAAIADGGTGLATADQIYDFVTSQINAIPSETVTSLAFSANTLTYTDEDGNDTALDLSLYLDDTNLARLTSGTIDNTTGVATFTRDDSTTFTIDMSAFLDGITVNNTLTSTSTTEGLSAAQGKVLKDLIDNLPDNDTQLTDAEIAAMGYIKDYTPTEAEITAHEAALSIAYSQVTGVPSASTTVSGIIEIATNTEAKAGTDSSRAVTPLGMKQTIDQENDANRVNVLIGDATNTTLTATHNFGNAKCLISVTEVATGDEVYAQIEKDTNSIDLTFGTAPASNAYEVSILKMS